MFYSNISAVAASRPIVPVQPGLDIPSGPSSPASSRSKSEARRCNFFSSSVVEEAGIGAPGPSQRADWAAPVPKRKHMKQRATRALHTCYFSGDGRPSRKVKKQTCLDCGEPKPDDFIDLDSPDDADNLDSSDDTD
uniref:Stc1 domain-containing protein n=1 Tax=Panagrolaimus superbus TaxID=310955 RepID=A0A914Z4E6_9BILA